MDTLPICQAKSKRSGQRCKNFAVKAKRVCHMHGGKSTGPRTKKGLMKAASANLKHGWNTKAALAEVKFLKQLFRDCKKKFGAMKPTQY